MKFDQLLYFLEAAKTEHLGRAAKALHISPGAISHSIAALEDELGKSLFSRDGRKIVLTEHGKLLRERAEALLKQAETIRQELLSDQLDLRGHYRLAGSHFLCERYLVPSWAHTQATNPKLTAEIFTLRSSQVVAGVLSGEYDYGLCFNPLVHPQLSQRTLKTGKLAVVIRKSHPLVSSESGAKALSGLSQYPAVLPKAFNGIDVCETHPVFEKHGIHVKTDCLIDSYATSLAKVAHSDSWGFVPDWLAVGYEGVTLLKLPKTWEAPYFVSLVWAKGAAVTGVLKTLSEDLQGLLNAK